MFYTKWTVWSHENEYRLLHTYRNGKVQKLDEDIISEVILGCKFNDNDKITLVPKLLEIYSHIKIYEIRLNKDCFKLEKHLILDGSIRNVLYNAQGVYN